MTGLIKLFEGTEVTYEDYKDELAPIFEELLVHNEMTKLTDFTLFESTFQAFAFVADDQEFD